MATTYDEMIAELQRDFEKVRQERDAALAREIALAEVLNVINRSPGDPGPVFEAILEKAHRLCGVAIGSLMTFDGTYFRALATRGLPEQRAALVRQPFRPTALSQPLANGERFSHILDLRAVEVRRDDELTHNLVERTEVRTCLLVPLRKDSVLLGYISAFRYEVRPFSENEITLLESFAAQAVIAMENARLLGELRQRTSDLQESLEYQTATSDVLKVISRRSTFDLQPVLNTVVETATRLCDAETGVITSREADGYRVTATFSMNPEFGSFLYGRLLPVIRGNITGRTALEGRIVHIEDIQADPEWTLHEATTIENGRTMLGVPLLREGAVTGTINLARRAIRPFTDKQIELVSTFADQAVIAIETTRLLTEQQEALEQQTATAKVLQVINNSPGDLTPVFDAMLEKALELCGAAFGVLWTFDGERVHAVALRGVPPAFAEFLTRMPHPVGPDNAHGRLLLGESVVHIADVTDDKAYRSDDPVRRTLVNLGGGRTLLAVPLRKDEAFLGDFVIYRVEVRPFSDKQIALLQNFAAQAVIAMENARLITEQREALEQQTATAEVLQVINASPGDLAPVFDAMLEKAMRLCAAACGGLFTYDGERFQTVAARGVPAAMAEFREKNPPTVQLGGHVKRMLETRRPFHILDWIEEETYQNGDIDARAIVDLGGARSNILVPLLKEEAVVGFFGLYRQEVRAFTDRQVALLENFATQAVIAMENARLLEELRQRTGDLQESLEYQTAISDVLKVISRSTFDLDPVFQAVVTTAVRLCRADQATIYRYQDGEYRWAAGFGLAADYERIEREVRILPGAGTLVGRVALEGRMVQIIDAWTDPLYEAKEDARVGGVRTMLGVPLLRDRAPIGVIGLARRRIEPYTERQIELVSTFAEQGVIAIGSVATFQALQERTGELTRSVAELQALEEVLRAVNSSLDLDTVLDTIISRAVQLSQADEGTIYEYDEAEEVFVPMAAFGMTVERLTALRERRVRLGETHLGRAAVQRAPVHISDVQQDPSMPGVGELLHGIHAVLAVPLLRDGTVIGGLVIRRRTAGDFAPTIATLLQTFAGQSVLAIENARLFQEARRARATAEVALTDLRRAQANLIQAEKMASLGQLTAGIAHEIKNPLNFVNNFAILSVELLSELKQIAITALASLESEQRAEVAEVIGLLTSNLEKITEHGKRADGIVKSMLEHSRGASGERRAVDINTLADEALHLAYHGARAQDQSFSISLERDFGEDIAPIEVNPQDITRVLLNLFSNGFYAANERARSGAEPRSDPTMKVTTRDLGAVIEVRVRDNGTGVPTEIRDKLFEPFFTTKPTGEGTGLGLSITYDIVTKQHGGTITVDSEVDAFTEFVVTLPRRMFATEVDRP